MGLQPGWEVGMVVCPLGRCEIPAGCPPVNTVLQHLVEARYGSYVDYAQEDVNALQRAEEELEGFVASAEEVVAPVM